MGIVNDIVKPSLFVPREIEIFTPRKIVWLQFLGWSSDLLVALFVLFALYTTYVLIYTLLSPPAKGVDADDRAQATLNPGTK